jgi:hypothetical protein
MEVNCVPRKGRRQCVIDVKDGRRRETRSGLGAIAYPLPLVLLLVLPLLVAHPMPGYAFALEETMKSATVPMSLDHDRMLVDAQIERADGTRRSVRLWVDTGAPDFFMSEARPVISGLTSQRRRAPRTVGERRLKSPPPPVSVWAECRSIFRV